MTNDLEPMYNKAAMKSINPPTPRFALTDDVRETRPFYLIVMAVLAGLSGLALYSSTELHAPERLIPFTLLMLLHAGLHWTSPRVVGNLRASVIYLVVQGALVFVLPLIARADYLVMGLSLALIGEAVGILWDVTRVAIAIVVYLALMAVDLLLLSEINPLPTWALAALPMTLFVVVYVVLYSRQAQARAHAQALLVELETAHRQLSEYAARVEDLTLANERQRMARELHDTLAQGLAGLILQLEAANTHLTNGRADRAQTILQQAMTRARATLGDARRAIDDLRAGQTAIRDLDEALREQIAHFTDATGIPCALDVSLPSVLPDAAREHVLRAVTEGLTNIARHAQAQHAWVNVRNADGKLIIELRDDGRGFDPATIPPGHYGLLGIRERARLACGALEITSAPGAGTTLRLQLPLGAKSP
jgi:NarL family two-component system sensor histidine kinase YdfH